MQALAQEGHDHAEVVTHEMAFARDVSARRWYSCIRGVICEQGTPAQVFGNPTAGDEGSSLARFRAWNKETAIVKDPGC